MAELNVDKVFIVHYKKYLNRKSRIDNFLSKNNITNYQFRYFFNNDETVENLPEELKNKYIQFSHEVLGVWKPESVQGNACCAVKHIEILKEIAENGIDDKWYLVMEDDSLPIEDDFVNQLNYYLENVPEDAEFLDMNGYCPHEEYIVNSSDLWIRKKSGRTIISYLIKKETCKKMLKNIIPVTTAIDFMYTRAISIDDIKLYWSNKPFFLINDNLPN